MSLNIHQPSYWHRETKNDVGFKTENSWMQTFKEAGCTLLPFAALYKPAVYPLTVATGILRAFRFGSALETAACNDKTKPLALRYLAVQTAVSTAALVGMFAGHPLGMLITTGQDIMTEAWVLLHNVKNGNRRSAFENTLHLVNNALYFALFLKGSVGLAVASLALQVLNNLYHSITEYQKGNKIQAAAHFAMMGLRSSQLAMQTAILVDHTKNPVIGEGDIQELRHYGNWSSIKFKGSNNNWVVKNLGNANWKVGDHIVVQRINWQGHNTKFTNDTSHDTRYW